MPDFTSTWGDLLSQNEQASQGTAHKKRKTKQKKKQENKKWRGKAFRQLFSLSIFILKFRMADEIGHPISKSFFF